MSSPSAATAAAPNAAVAPSASKKSDDAVYSARRRPRPGVGSNGSHPYPSNQTSTHVWAFVSATVQRASCPSKRPVVKPAATRAGIPR